MAAGVLSIGIAATYWILRIGFDDPIASPVRAAALALFIHSFPLVVSELVFRRSEQVVPRWWTSYGFLWILALVVAAMFGRIVPILGFSAFPLLALVGVGSFAWIFVRWLTRAALWRSLTLILGAGAFSVWASGVVWGRIYKNPLYLENLILNGNVHHDTLDVVATANMLRTYHVATNGLDGLNYVPWHWGSAWFFAQFAYLLDLNMLDFYQLAFPVITIPLFFGAPLAFAVAMRNRRQGPDAGVDLRADFRWWGVLLVACIGIIPISGLDAMGVWTSNPLISDSYTFGVPVAILFLGTCITLYDSLKEDSREGATRGKADLLFVVLGVPLGILGVGYLKSSLMFLAFALALYAFVRLRLYRRPLYVASIVLAAILVYVGNKAVVLPGHKEGLVPFDFLWSFVKPAWWPFFPTVHLFWSWLYTFLRLRLEGVGTLSDLWEAFHERRILDVEAVALIAILGIAPGMILHIDGGSAFYFSDVQRWVALAFLLSWLPAIMRSFAAEPEENQPRAARTMLSRLDSMPVRRIAVAFLLIPVVGSVLSNSIVWPLAMVRANAETRHALYPPAIAASIPHGLHGLLRLHDPALLEQGLRSSRNFGVADGLERLREEPTTLRRRSVLFIPQDQRAYWTSLTRKGACTFEPFLGPALSSIAMIDGMPPYGCTVNRYYGLGQYAPRTRPQLPEDGEPSVLCRRAAAAGMNRVVVLTFDSAGRAVSSPILCSRAL